MKFDIILQARFLSTRLPGKILLNFGQKTLLEFLITNLKKIKKVNKIILATPDDKFKNIFYKISKKNKIYFFSEKIDEKNLLKRYFKCAKKFGSKNIIRITSDCPFINPHMVTKMIKFYETNQLTFLTNNKPRFIPHGFDCEIINKNLLNKVFFNAKKSYDKEHATQWIYKNIFNRNINYIKLFRKNCSKLRLTIDYPGDYIFFKKNELILKKISNNKNYEKCCYNLNKKLYE